MTQHWVQRQVTGDQLVHFATILRAAGDRVAPMAGEQAAVMAEAGHRLFDYLQPVGRVR